MNYISALNNPSVTDLKSNNKIKMNMFYRANVTIGHTISFFKRLFISSRR